MKPLMRVFFFFLNQEYGNVVGVMEDAYGVWNTIERPEKSNKELVDINVETGRRR